MESNTARISEKLNYPPQKRKLDSESNSINDEDLQLLGNNSSQLLCQLEAKNREFEERMNSMHTKFCQEFKSQHEQVLSRIDVFERRLSRIETMNQDVPRHINNPKQNSRGIKPTDASIDQLTQDFEERFELVESNSQTITERLDSCQQNFAKMSVKTETFENQLGNLQQRLNNFEMHDTNMQGNETILTQQHVEENMYQNPSTIEKTSKGTVVYHCKHTKKCTHRFVL